LAFKEDLVAARDHKESDDEHLIRTQSPNLNSIVHFDTKIILLMQQMIQIFDNDF